MPIPPYFRIQVQLGEYEEGDYQIDEDGVARSKLRFKPCIQGYNQNPNDSSDADNEENAVRMAEGMVRDLFRRKRAKDARLANPVRPVVVPDPGGPDYRRDGDIKAIS